MRWLVALLFLLPGIVMAETAGSGCTMAWDYVEPMPSNVDGFRVYINDAEAWTGTEKTVSCEDAGVTVAGEYTAYVKAYNAAAESDPSNTLTFVFVTDAPAEPLNFRFQN